MALDIEKLKAQQTPARCAALCRYVGGITENEAVKVAAARREAEFMAEVRRQAGQRYAPAYYKQRPFSPNTAELDEELRRQAQRHRSADAPPPCPEPKSVGEFVWGLIEAGPWNFIIVGILWIISGLIWPTETWDNFFYRPLIIMGVGYPVVFLVYILYPNRDRSHNG